MDLNFGKVVVIDRGWCWANDGRQKSACCW